MAKSPFLRCPRLCPGKCREAVLLHVLVGWGTLLMEPLLMGWCPSRKCVFNEEVLRY